MYSFENFYKKKEGRTALTVQALLNLSAALINEIKPKTGLFYIINGLPNTGKTHLIEAFKNTLKDSKYKIFHENSNDFSDLFIKSIKLNKPDDFKNSMQSHDILIIEHIEDCRGKEGIQHELLNLINYFISSGKTILITTSYYENFLELEKDLYAKLQNAVMLTVETPDLESMKTYINDNANSMELELDKGVAEYCVKRFGSSIATIKSAVKLLKLIADLKGTTALDFATIEPYM